MRKSVILAVCYAVFAAAVIAWSVVTGEVYLLLLAAYAGIMSAIVLITGDRSDSDRKYSGKYTGKKSPKVSDGES